MNKRKSILVYKVDVLKRKVSSAGMVFILLLASMLPSVFIIKPVRAESGTIYIRADGSIEPATAPIQRNGNIYTFTANIYDSIVVEKDNIVIDGAGYTLQGTSVYDSKGIYLSSRTNVTIRNVQIKNFYYGISLWYSSNNNISGNNIENNSGFGIELWYSSNNNISGNNIANNSYYGIYLKSSSNNNISGNNIENNSDGIWLYESSNNSIIRNNIENNSCDGIHFWDSSSNNNISGNNIANNDLGIYLDSSSNNSISGNNIANNEYGISLGSSSNNTISGNNIENNSVAGISLGSSSNNTISGNNIANNFYGIHLYSSSNNSISGNNIANSAWAGISLGSSSNNTISGNNIANNFHGIHLYSSSNNSISGNNIENNRANGIHLYSSSNNSISGNNIINGLYGINVNSSSNIQVHYCNIYGNANYGIYNVETEGKYQVNATYNYWGDASGPYHPTLNPYGKGDNVSNNVLFDLWLTAPYGMVNHPPVSNNDYYSTNEDVALIVNAPGVLGNDTDADGDKLTAVLVSNPSHGSLTLNSNGSFTYTPSSNYYGSDSFTYKAYDGMNYSNIATVYITINSINDAPVSNFNFYPENPIVGQSIYFNSTSYDTNGYIVNYTWNFGDGSIGYGEKVIHVYNEAGKYNVTLVVRDNDGTTASIMKEILIYLKDLTPPTTTITFGTPYYYDGINHWVTTSTPITLKANDNESGVNKTYYRIDGGDWSEYTSSFKISSEGTHTIYYYSTDKSGNREADKSISIKIDKSPPTANHSLSGTSVYGRYITNVTISFTASDAFSGVKEIRYKVDGISYVIYGSYGNHTVSAEGNHVVEYYAIDNAGNAGSISTFSFIIHKNNQPVSKFHFIVLILSIIALIISVLLALRTLKKLKQKNLIK